MEILCTVVSRSRVNNWVAASRRGPESAESIRVQVSGENRQLASAGRRESSPVG